MWKWGVLTCHLLVGGWVGGGLPGSRGFTQAQTGVWATSPRLHRRFGLRPTRQLGHYVYHADATCQMPHGTQMPYAACTAPALASAPPTGVVDDGNVGLGLGPELGVVQRDALLGVEDVGQRPPGVAVELIQKVLHRWRRRRQQCEGTRPKQHQHIFRGNKTK